MRRACPTLCLGVQRLIAGRIRIPIHVGGGGVTRGEQRRVRVGGGELRCGCALLNPNARVRKVKGACHELVGGSGGGCSQRLLLGLEVVVQQFLVEEVVGRELL
jgi:hypothetical protein